MKKFFRKFFFWDEPSAGAVFGYLLAAVSGVCLANILCFTGLIAAQSFSVSLAALTAGKVLLSAYCLFLVFRFFFRQDRSCCKWIYWTISLFYITIIVSCFNFGYERGGAVGGAVLICAGFNALCVRKYNIWWYIAQTVCLFLWLIPATVLLDSLQVLGWINAGEAGLNPIPVNWRVPAVYFGVLFFISFVFCNFKLWSSAENRRLRDVWGWKCNILLIILVLVYTCCVCSAWFQQKECEKAVVALEEKFQRKISCKAVKDIYFRDRKCDEKFHAAFQKVSADFFDIAQPYTYAIDEVSALDKVPAAVRERFLSCKAEDFGRFFDAPFPAMKRDFSAGKSMAMDMSDVSAMRPAARFLTGVLRIACDNRDRAMAMRAWKRFDTIKKYLEHDISVVGALVMIYSETLRMQGLGMMLSSSILTDDDLTEVQQYLQQSAEQMVEMNRKHLYFEAVFLYDALCGVADGSVAVFPEQAGAEGVKNYRFLFPGIWYLAAYNCNYMLNRFHVENLSSFNEDVITDHSPKLLLASMIMPALKRAGDRMMEMEMHYQCFNALVEAEKIKRQTGKYPETLPLNIIDRFRGKALRYKIGNHEIQEKFIRYEKDDDGEVTGILELRNRSVPGIAVWSVGKNKLDDNGVYDPNRHPAEPAVDDLRALLIKEELEK